MLVRGSVSGAAVLLLLASGCSVQNQPNVSTRTGTAYAGDNEVTIKGDDGWYYSVPTDVDWSDTAGTRHRAIDRPACRRQGARNE